MAVSLNKTYSITLKYSYEPAATIVDTDLHVAELRGFIKKWIADRVGHVNQGNLVVHIVGSVTEV